jgi:predicted kinase
MERKKINVYVLIGLPGAGKDTWIMNNLPNTHKVVCRDDIRAEIGLCNAGEKIVATPQQENLVTSLFNTKLKEYARAGEDIAINNTNLRRKYRMEYKKILVGFDVNWIYVIVEAPDLDTNKARRKGQIPPEVFDRLKASYEPPTPDEYDEIIYAKQEKI